MNRKKGRSCLHVRAHEGRQALDATQDQQVAPQRPRQLGRLVCVLWEAVQKIGHLPNPQIHIRCKLGRPAKGREAILRMIGSLRQELGLQHPRQRRLLERRPRPHGMLPPRLLERLPLLERLLHHMGAYLAMTVPQQDPEQVAVFAARVLERGHVPHQILGRVHTHGRIALCKQQRQHRQRVCVREVAQHKRLAQQVPAGHDLDPCKAEPQRLQRAQTFGLQGRKPQPSIRRVDQLRRLCRRLQLLPPLPTRQCPGGAPCGPIHTCTKSKSLMMCIQSCCVYVISCR